MTKFGKILTFGIFAVIMLVIVLVFTVDWKGSENRKAKLEDKKDIVSEQAIRDRESQETEIIEKIVLPQVEISKTELAENCARDIPREKIDDTFLDLENKIVRTSWWDNEIGDNVSIIIPYEPEIDFAGCSESVKGLLRHIQETAEDF